MDSSSIITQVNRDDELLNGFAASEKESTTPPTSKTKKTRNRGILRNVLCCFGAKNTKKAEELNNTPVPSNDENGIYKPTTQKFLLPPKLPSDEMKSCLIIDLDETLVHSSFKPVDNPDFIVPVEIDGTVHQVYVLKRPFVDDFLQKMGELYECVLFTASLAKYADPVANLLDNWNVFRARLFRESCVFHRGNYVKDLGRLGRELQRIIIVDNSPASYIFHPENAIAVSSWFDDVNDHELRDLVPFLEELAKTDNVYRLLQTPSNGNMSNNSDAMEACAESDIVIATTTDDNTNSA